MATSKKASKAASSYPVPKFEQSRLFETDGSYVANRGKPKWKSEYQIQLKNTTGVTLNITNVKVLNILEDNGGKGGSKNTFKVNGKVNTMPKLPLKLSPGSEININVPIIRTLSYPKGTGVSPYFNVSYVPVDGPPLNTYTEWANN